MSSKRFRLDGGACCVSLGKIPHSANSTFLQNLPDLIFSCIFSCFCLCLSLCEKGIERDFWKVNVGPAASYHAADESDILRETSPEVLTQVQIALYEINAVSCTHSEMSGYHGRVFFYISGGCLLHIFRCLDELSKQQQRLISTAQHILFSI